MTKEKMEKLFGTDNAIGVMFEVESEHGVEVIQIDEYDRRYKGLPYDQMPDMVSLMPDGSSAVCCTNYARHILAVLSPEGYRVELVGFANKDNPASLCAKEEYHPEGHDFAIVNERFLVDPWVRLVAAVEQQIVYDLDDPVDLEKATQIYGLRQNWLPL